MAFDTGAEYATAPTPIEDLTTHIDDTTAEPADKTVSCSAARSASANSARSASANSAVRQTASSPTGPSTSANRKQAARWPLDKLTVAYNQNELRDLSKIAQDKKDVKTVSDQTISSTLVMLIQLGTFLFVAFCLLIMWLIITLLKINYYMFYFVVLRMYRILLYIIRNTNMKYVFHILLIIWTRFQERTEYERNRI